MEVIALSCHTLCRHGQLVVVIEHLRKRNSACERENKMSGANRSRKPHENCHVTKKEWLNDRKNPLSVIDDCPICLEANVHCRVAFHPSSGTSTGGSLINDPLEPSTSGKLFEFNLKCVTPTMG
jgi:hypothetical protein